MDVNISILSRQNVQQLSVYTILIHIWVEKEDRWEYYSRSLHPVLRKNVSYVLFSNV